MRSIRAGAASLDWGTNLGDFSGTLRNSAGKAVTQRYFFNLTDGDEVILDTVGVEACDLNSARVHAFETIQDMLRDDPTIAEDSAGWCLEIVNTSGWTVDTISLERAAQSSPLRH